MDWYRTVFEVIDMRSFSNLWYWIGLAVLWSSTSHWVLGVPHDMILRARRQGGQAEADLRDIVRVNCNRLNYVARVSGVWLVLFSSLVFTSLAILGFSYGIEFAQATFLLIFPLVMVGLSSLWTARLIEREGFQGERLYVLLRRQRTITQFIGMVAIFITAMWGMHQNLATGPLGGSIG